MSEYISKSAVVDHLNEKAYEMHKSSRVTSAGVILKLRDEIQSGRFDAPGWISVEDQLPDRDDDYLVRHKAGHLEVAQYDLGRWLLHGEDGFLLPLTDKVTHWMSLPEPPKEADGR